MAYVTRAVRQQMRDDYNERSNPRLAADRIARYKIADEINARFQPRFDDLEARLSGKDLAKAFVDLRREQQREQRAAEEAAGLWR